MQIAFLWVEVAPDFLAMAPGRQIFLSIASDIFSDEIAEEGFPIATPIGEAGGAGDPDDQAAKGTQFCA